MTADSKDRQMASNPVDTTDVIPQSEDTKVHATDANVHDSATNNTDNDNNATSPEAGLAALHEAIRSGRCNCAHEVDLLISNTPVDVNAVDSTTGNTALHLAAQLTDEFDAVDVALVLLKHGADPDAKDTSLRRPSDYAISNGHVHLADYLTSSGGTTIDEAIEAARLRKEEHFTIALRQATKNASIDDIRTCLERGANPNTLNQYGVGALHLAVVRCPADRQRAVVEMLVDGGADVNLRDKEGDPALNLLLKCGNYDNDGRMATLVEYLVGKGTDCGLKDLDGKDASMLAKERQYGELVTLFQKAAYTHKPARKARKDEVGPSPATATPATEESFIADETEKHVTVDGNEKEDTKGDAKEEVREESTLVLFYAALRDGSLSEVMRHLSDNENNVNTPHERGNAPLHIAILRESDDDNKQIICDRLLSCGASVDLQRQSDGKTSLHLAVERNDVLAVQLLLDSKADINISSQDGETPHDTAIRLCHEEVAKLLDPTRVEVNTDKPRKKARTCCII